MTIFDKKELVEKMNATANQCIKNALSNAYWEDEVVIASETPVEEAYVKCVVKTIKYKILAIIYDLK